MKRGQAIGLAVVASCATGLLAGGITWAAIPDGGGAINACYGKIAGIVRVIDTAKQERCTVLENAISWNQKGIKGDPGTQGAPGMSPTVAQLADNDPNCPSGGLAITDANGSTGYVCNGVDGQDGESFSGTFASPNGEYRISVSDTGITLSAGNRDVLKIAGDDLNIRTDGNTTVESGLKLMLKSGTDTEVRAGLSLKELANVQVNVEGAITTVKGGAQLSLNGGVTFVGTNTGCRPAARIGDSVQATTTGDLQISSGAPAVLVC